MSIYAKPDERNSRETEANRLLEEETKHLKKRGGTRDPLRETRSFIHLATFVIIVGAFFFWLWDPIEFSLKRQTAIDAYFYLASRNDTAMSGALYNSFFFDGTDQIQLKAHVFDNKPATVFATTDEARAAGQSCLDFANRIHCLRTGELDNLDTFAVLRYYLFYKWGIDPPIPLRFLNVRISSPDWFPAKKEKDPGDPFGNI